MKAIVISIALAALSMGIATFADPAPAPTIDARHFPHCSHGRYCGAPEPDGCTGKCEYWQNCGPNCGCRRIQNCVP